jgi:hypothetical protein
MISIALLSDAIAALTVIASIVSPSSANLSIHSCADNA